MEIDELLKTFTIFRKPALSLSANYTSFENES